MVKIASAMLPIFDLSLCMALSYLRCGKHFEL